MKTNRFKFLVAAALTLAALALAGPTVWGETITKTYHFNGKQTQTPSSTTCEGYFYEEGITGAHYTWMATAYGSKALLDSRTSSSRVPTLRCSKASHPSQKPNPAM